MKYRKTYVIENIWNFHLARNTLHETFFIDDKYWRNFECYVDEYEKPAKNQLFNGNGLN
jgi:hypothetical protein